MNRSSAKMPSMVASSGTVLELHDCVIAAIAALQGSLVHCSVWYCQHACYLHVRILVAAGLIRSQQDCILMCAPAVCLLVDRHTQGSRPSGMLRTSNTGTLFAVWSSMSCNSVACCYSRLSLLVLLPALCKVVKCIYFSLSVSVALCTAKKGLLHLQLSLGGCLGQQERFCTHVHFISISLCSCTLSCPLLAPPLI